jgi:hypothetical protein
MLPLHEFRQMRDAHAVASILDRLPRLVERGREVNGYLVPIWREIRRMKRQAQKNGTQLDTHRIDHLQSQAAEWGWEYQRLSADYWAGISRLKVLCSKDPDMPKVVLFDPNDPRERVEIDADQDNAIKILRLLGYKIEGEENDEQTREKRNRVDEHQAS